MSISKDALGMNARNFLYISRYNKSRAKSRADNKLETKKQLIKYGIPTSDILQTFTTRKTLKTYSWDYLPSTGFVIKPARGYGGEGILIIEKWEGNQGITPTGKKYSLKQIKSHIMDIFDGIYSLGQLPDQAYIEERIVPSDFFKKLAGHGLADIRVIVFNKIPVMAMVRLPTPTSSGKANLHQGAIGVGVGMRTGITSNALQKGKFLRLLPETKLKASGIKIPEWNEILLLASRAQNVSGLGFAGVDIVVDRRRGPVVLEINARPGLAIQNVNGASLRERLERVEELPVTSPERGVEITKSMFAENFSEKVRNEPKVLSLIEPITILQNGNSRLYRAKIDTGAYRTSLDTSVIQEMGLPILERKFKTVSATGRQVRAGVRLTFLLGGKKITTTATVAARSHLRFPIIIGRRDLQGFYVNPVVPLAKEEEIHEDTEDSDREMFE